MNFPIRCLMFVMLVCPVLAGPAPASAPSREYTFADFCRENPTLNQPVGTDPVWVEWLVVEGPVLPDQPTSEMLQSGRLVRQVTRLNRCANTEQWQLVDRAPDGRPLANPRRIGSALFTRVIALKEGSIDLDFRATLVPPPIWIDANSAVEPVYQGSVSSSKLVVLPGEWIKGGSSSAARVTKTSDGIETTSNSVQTFYLRVLLKPKASSAAH